MNAGFLIFIFSQIDVVTYIESDKEDLDARLSVLKQQKITHFLFFLLT